MYYWMFITASCSLLFLFMVVFPAKWGGFVEKENKFWADKNIFSQVTTEKFIKFEKGIAFKILILGLTLLGLFILI